MWVPNAATVFMIDGDPQSRRSVCEVVASMDLQFEGFGAARDFFAAYPPGRPGCLVTEVRAVDLSGPEIQRRLATMQAPLPVVFLSAYATVPILVRVMRAGALDFLEKPLREERFWKVIQKAILLSGALRERMERQKELRRQIATLSPKERRVLGLLAEGLSRRAIASELELSVRTVEFSRARAMKKLAIDNQAELLRFTMTALSDFGLDSDDAAGNSESLLLDTVNNRSGRPARSFNWRNWDVCQQSLRVERG